MRSLILTCFLLIPLYSFGGVRVGYSESDLTPSFSEAAESCLGGYEPLSRCGVTEIHNEISVRALAVSSGDQLLILAAIDTIGLGDSLIDDIRAKVSLFSFGQIAPGDIFLTATHTHHGPDLQGIWGGVSDEYRKRIVRESAKTILRAYYRRLSASVYVSEAEVDVENRRGWQEVDTTMKIIEFRNRWTNKSIGTLVNMSAHPTTIDRTIQAYSSDYIGKLRSTIEEHTDTNVLFLNGIVGDAQPAVTDPLSLQTADAYGAEMGLRAVAATNGQIAISGDLKIKTEEFSHAVENEAIIGAVLMGILDLNLSSDYTVTTKISVFQIGNDLSGILFPGEALTRLGIPLRDALPGTQKLFVGLAGASLGYFIPSDEFLMIPGRTTEERLSLHPLIGDNATMVLEGLIDAPYPATEECQDLETFPFRAAAHH